jgi:methyl-accepting chemotaxis protein
MTDAAPASAPLWAAYSAFLSGQWPRRTQRLSEAALMGSVLLLVSDSLSEGMGVATSARPLLAVLGVRLGCLMLPAVTLLLLRNFPEWRAAPWAGIALIGAWLVGSQAAFYYVGTQRSIPHVALLLWSLFFIPLVLPLRSQARGLFYALVVASYAVLELALDPLYPMVSRMLGIASLGGVAGAIAWTLERTLRTLRQHFFLKQEMSTAEQALQDSQARIGESAEAILRLVEKLRDSTLELCNASSRARTETARIAHASEKVAHTAQAASLRASGVGAIVSDATGHTQRIDDEMNWVEVGLNSIGQAIGLTESSLQELTTHAQQIAEFTETLQEFANQTDVLALNAAMEAARAGEAGRSFSVVAREVRRLAEASKASSEKIHEVVQGTRAQLDSALKGMGVIRETMRQFESSFTDARKTLEAIRAIVTKIETLMHSTVADAKEQAAATGNISAGSTQLQQMINSQAKMSEEVALTAELLGRVADELRALVPKKEPASKPPEPQARPAPTASLPDPRVAAA